MNDPIIQKLLENAIDTPIKLQLVLLFCDQPQLHGGADAIASRIYRDIWSTREALQEMAQDGLLKTSGEGPALVYQYCPTPEHSQAITRLRNIYNEPFERDTIHQKVRELASYGPYRRTTHATAFAYEHI